MMNTYNIEDLERNLAQGQRTSSGAVSQLLRKVYAWMTLALAFTGLTALIVAGNPQISAVIWGNSFAFWVLLFVQIGLVIAFSSQLDKISFNWATALFILYSIVTGITMSVIFAAFTEDSIASTFFVTAGTFGTMSLYGYFTKKDLTGWGRYLMMGLIGIIIASLVNLFLASDAFMWITTYVGVVVFVGLTAYDTQKIKAMLYECESQGINDTTSKIALYGSFTLYLDFINLFLKLLRIFGRRK